MCIFKTPFFKVISFVILSGNSLFSLYFLSYDNENVYTYIIYIYIFICIWQVALETFLFIYIIHTNVHIFLFKCIHIQMTFSHAVIRSDHFNKNTKIKIIECRWMNKQLLKNNCTLSSKIIFFFLDNKFTFFCWCILFYF